MRLVENNSKGLKKILQNKSADFFQGNHCQRIFYFFKQLTINNYPTMSGMVIKW